MIRIVCAILLACAAPAARADSAGAYVVLEIEEAPLRQQRLFDLAWMMAGALRDAAPAIRADEPESDGEAARHR